MQDEPQNNLPSMLKNIEAETQALGFAMASGRKTGAFLRTLAAVMPGGSVLELGTGTGLATCWLLDGMDEAASLITVDNDESVVAVARKHLG
jgi:predicted O-methyltransferase YrrM